MINIALTFDYELFLGKNNAPEQDILFEPTNQIMTVLEKENIKATFFVDVCSALRYQDYGRKHYSDLMREQLKDMYRRGFDPQLHIHSNWLKSELINEVWRFDTDSYRLHTFQEQIGPVIKKAKAFLMDTLQPDYPDYKVVAYRAGGYCLQPSADILPILAEEGIFIDSSVAAYTRCDNAERYYDYRQMPEIPNWFVGPDKEWNQPSCSENAVFEIPVWSIANPVINHIFNKEKVIFCKDARKGNFIQSPSYKKKSWIETIFKYASGRTLLSLDTLAAPYLWKKILKLEKKYNNAYIAVVSHPKLYGKNALKNIEIFAKEAEKHSSTVRFVTMTDIYNERRSN